MGFDYEREFLENRAFKIGFGRIGACVGERWKEQNCSSGGETEEWMECNFVGFFQIP